MPIHRPTRLRILPVAVFLFLVLLVPSAPLSAIPVFAHQYDLTCTACHGAFPRLNDFDRQFQANNYRLPNWREKITADTIFEGININTLTATMS